MKILGIDSSGMVAGVAVVQDDITVAEYNVNYKKTHSQTLLPMIDAVVEMLELDINELDAIAIAAGPGSFTGLRIGSATVKGLGLAIDKPIVPVPTCHGLAYNVCGTDRLICPIMDARRNQVYTGIYSFEQNKLVVHENQMAIDVCELIQRLEKYNRPVLFLGDGVPVYRKTIDEQMLGEHCYAPVHLNRQRASSIAALGMEMYKAGQYESADEHAPIYLRKSQAEREREEKLENEGK